MPSLSAWDNTLSALRGNIADVELTMPIKQSTAGGSGAFLGRANDGQNYWVKTLNNGQGDRVPITEQIVGRVGALIEAPVCIVRKISIPDVLAGWEFRRGRYLEAGIAHGSLGVENVTETRSMNHRLENDNATRHLYLMALYDLCWGSDQQWLVCLSDQFKYHSHGHGWYFPPSGPSWSKQGLLDVIDDECLLHDSGKFLDHAVVPALVAKLRAMTQQFITPALASVPTSWPVTDEELEAIGFFLESRATSVADRVEQRFLTP